MQDKPNANTMAYRKLATNCRYSVKLTPQLYDLGLCFQSERIGATELADECRDGGLQQYRRGFSVL